MTTESSWKQWNPGLKNGHLTLQNILTTLPGNQKDTIHYLVRLFENPASPLAFRGAISLARHDCVHIVLGRGLLAQDEAFVIGFTMGTAPYMGVVESRLFEYVTRYIYPAPYRFSEVEVKVFRLGLEAGKASNIHKIYALPLENWTERSLSDIRQTLGLDIASLKNWYRQEQQLLPETVASKRLEVE